MIQPEEITREEARKIIFPTSDIFSRYLLSSEKYKDLAKSFINAVLEDSGKTPVESITIKSPFNLADCFTGKESILDAATADTEGRMYDIEIQNSSSPAFFQRIAYYWAEMYKSQLKNADSYDILRPCIMIGLMKEKLFTETEKPHHISKVVDAEEPLLSYFSPADLMEYHILELDRFEINRNALYTVDRAGNKRRITPALFSWLRFFKDGGREDFMKEYAETDTCISEAKQAYEQFISDDELRLAQIRHEMWLHDRAQEKSDARREGLAEGRAEGRKESARLIAENMKKAGVSEADIIKFTNLSAGEIASL